MKISCLKLRLSIDRNAVINGAIVVDKSKCIKGVDICQSLAIGFSMLIHVFVTFGTGLIGDVMGLVRSAI